MPRRHGHSTLLLVMGGSVVIAVLAFAHAASVRETRNQVRRSIAGRHALMMASNLADEAPRLAQLALNAAGEAQFSESGLSHSLSEQVRSVGVGQYLRLQVPSNDMVEVINGMPVQISELRAEAIFTEVDGTVDDVSENACAEFASWRQRWPPSGG